MITSAKKIGKSPVAFLLVGAVCILMAATVDARGGRGGGFSRSSPASGGSISSRPAVERQGGVATQPRTARNTGDVGTPRAARNAGDVGQPQSAQSASGVGSTEGAGSTRAVRDSNPVTAQEMAKYREQFQQQNKDQGADWDARRPVDPEYGVPETGTGLVVGRPAAVVGAVAGAAAVARADDYVDFVNTVDDPGYLAEDDCSVKAITAVNDVTYYRCSDAWYKRGYQGGSVVYIPTDAPAGY